MAAGRPAVPAEVERSVLVEAGHRCAIPTCRQTPVEIAHVEPFAQVRKHEFPNLIALCPTCHARYDRGEIDRKAMRQYKANLGLLASRYGEVERRVIEYFAENPNESVVHLPGGMQILVRYLVKDGYLDVGEPYMASAVTQGGIQSMLVESLCPYVLTPTGRDFVTSWVEANPLDDVLTQDD
jgi:hypothetical protein